MRYIIALVLMSLALPSWAQEWEDRQVFNAATGQTQLRIISSTDTALFAPLIEPFIAQNPDISIEYLVTGTSDIDKLFRKNPETYDIAISSAMDLQLKLTNDGYALAIEDVTHPEWAHWRHSLFAFTSEPASIVLNTEAFTGQPIPQTRQELIEALRARPEVFRHRVGTYDVRSSGLGYLFATQDARASETFWRLMEVMGSLDVRLYCCSGQMIDDLSSGRLAVAYNVLASYVAARGDSENLLQIILPAEFPTTMMRTAFVSSASQKPVEAERFIKHLIAHQARATRAQKALPPLQVERSNKERATIALEPALMTFLDLMKRKKFISEWESALIQK